MTHATSNSEIRLILITNDTALASIAYRAGVTRIFVDLEILGKQTRQGHLDTHITSHDVSDIARIRSAALNAELIVRINPLHDGTEAEITQALEGGADTLMLPMFRTMDEIRNVAQMIACRAGFIPLIETPEALGLSEAVLADPDVTEVYIGLNDLHLAMGRAFMFEFLAEGEIDRVAGLAQAAGKPFGFGGIARMDEGLLSGRMVLAEHLRLRSSTVILSRTFKRSEGVQTEAAYHAEFIAELGKLRTAEAELTGRHPDQIEQDRQTARDTICKIAQDREASRKGRTP